MKKFFDLIALFSALSGNANKTMRSNHCSCYKQASIFIVGGTHRHSNLLLTDHESLCWKWMKKYLTFCLSPLVCPLILCISVLIDVPLTFWVSLLFVCLFVYLQRSFFKKITFLYIKMESLSVKVVLQFSSVLLLLLRKEDFFSCSFFSSCHISCLWKLVWYLLSCSTALWCYVLILFPFWLDSIKLILFSFSSLRLLCVLSLFQWDKLLLKRN